MKLPWQFEEPMGQWRALDELLKKSERPLRRIVPGRVVFRAWWHTRRYLGMFEAWRFVEAMEAWA